VFASRVRELEGEAKADLAEALTEGSGPATVRSAFNLPEAQRAAITQALNDTFAADVPVRFEVAPDLISGIELTAGGQKVAWSISDYLTSLNQSIGELLKEHSSPETNAEQNTESDAKPAASMEDQ
jgi:F-type H+-transporting ATPase subunit b